MKEKKKEEWEGGKERDVRRAKRSEGESREAVKEVMKRRRSKE